MTPDDDTPATPLTADHAEGLVADMLGVESAIQQAMDRAQAVTRTVAALTLDAARQPTGEAGLREAERLREAAGMPARWSLSGAEQAVIDRQAWLVRELLGEPLALELAATHDLILANHRKDRAALTARSEETAALDAVLELRAEDTGLRAAAQAVSDAFPPDNGGTPRGDAIEALRAALSDSDTAVDDLGAASRPDGVEELAAALERVGASDIEQMAWSPLTNPPQYEGDPDLNVIREDPFPMASLAAAILAALPVPAPKDSEPGWSPPSEFDDTGPTMKDQARARWHRP